MDKAVDPEIDVYSELIQYGVGSDVQRLFIAPNMFLSTCLNIKLRASEEAFMSSYTCQGSFDRSWRRPHAQPLTSPAKGSSD